MFERSGWAGVRRGTPISGNAGDASCIFRDNGELIDNHGKGLVWHHAGVDACHGSMPVFRQAGHRPDGDSSSVGLSHPHADTLGSHR